MESINYKVINSAGQEKGQIELDPRVFGAKIRPDVVHETVRWQLTKRRAGTQSALGRSDMKGGGKKPWKQKGTGRARAGSNTSPLWVGGGVCHAPKPRSYEYRLPKRTRVSALISVLTDKLKEENLVVVDELNLSSGKTKDMVKFLSQLGLAGQKVLLVLDGVKPELFLAGRNIKGLNILTVDGLNPYDLLKNKYLLTSKEGVNLIQQRVNSKFNV